MSGFLLRTLHGINVQYLSKKRIFANIPEIFHKHEHHAVQMGKRAREIWEADFSPEQKARRMLTNIIDIWRGLQYRPFDLDAYHKSWRFFS